MDPPHESSTLNSSPSVKISVPGGIKAIYGEQLAAKEMFAIEEVIPISTLTTPKEPNSGTDPKAK